MNNYSTIVDAIDRLTTTVKPSSNIFLSECTSTALATLGSVAAVLIFEIIKNIFFVPRDDFRKLRRKVNGTLIMFACYYTNQLDFVNASAKEIECYHSASKSMREVAVDLRAFVDDFRGRKCCGVPVSDIVEAASLLMGLSNNFFTPSNSLEEMDNHYNDNLRHKIMKLLKIEHR